MVNVKLVRGPPAGRRRHHRHLRASRGDDVARRNRRRHLARVDKRRRPRDAVPADLGGPHEIAPVHRQREAGPPGRRARRGERGEHRHRLGALMVNVKPFEVPPPGAGVTTVTGTLPAVTMSLAGIAAVTWPAFTNVVVRAVPFQRTLEVPTKLLPFTVSVKPPPRPAVLVGASEVSAGTGFAAR